MLRPKALVSSLAVRLLLPLFAIVAVVLAVYAIVTLHATRRYYLSFVAAEAERSSGFIQRATRDGMLLNSLGDVQAIIERLAAEPDINAIRIYDPHGRIALSSARAELGSRTPRLQRTAAAGVVRKLTPLPREPACATAGCHAAADGTLGTLEVEMSMQPLETALRASRSHVIGTALVLMLVLGAAALLIVRQLMRQMADTVVKKTEELRTAQRQVLHMEKMASLGKLAATVAHELNNPLSGMLTYARLVERELADEPIHNDVRQEVERCLHLVQRECSRCGSIVQNLLVFARHSRADPAQIDLNEVLERSIMLIRHQLEISDIRLHTEPLPYDSRVVMDAGQMEQALVALLINAIEAMGKGGTLAVRLRGHADFVDIEVSDTGAGIPADILPLIFEPFFSTKNESGSGLGLAVVYGIIHRHGGTIDVDSTVGAGTTFHVRLPRSGQPQDVVDRNLVTAGAFV